MVMLGSYQNGNYRVFISDDGTKIRKNDCDELIPGTIESMDIKITNKCDIGCSYCHEDSRSDGVHGDIMGESFIDRLHPFTELAIGGGNPLSHPDLIRFLDKCQVKKLIPSITINQLHFEREYEKVKELASSHMIFGIGVSLVNPTDEFISKIKQFPNAVIHVIAGVVTVRQLERLRDQGLKILILGYKTVRRGIEHKSKCEHEVVSRMVELKRLLPTIINENWFDVISFDNLAIKQMDVKSLLSDDEWNEFYMGDDGFASMYVDMVERKFALNSCEPMNHRYELMDTIEEMFEYLKKGEKDGT